MIASIALSLLLAPSARLTGTIIDVSGGKPPEAFVMVHRGQKEVAHVFVRDGTFALDGLGEGAVRIQAFGPYGESESMAVELTQKTEVELSLVPRRKVRGSVTTAAGEPVAGATIYAVWPGDWALAYAKTRSPGTFELSLPSIATSATFIVTAPQFAGRIIQVPEGHFGEPIQIVMGTSGGRLRILFPTNVQLPTIEHSSDAVSLAYALKHAYELAGGEFAGDVEPGTYTVCAKGKCESAVISPSGEALIDVR